jgi:hypothetical protein
MITRPDSLQNEKPVLMLVSNNRQPTRKLQPPGCCILASMALSRDPNFLISHEF